MSKAQLVEIRSPHFITLCGRIFHNTDPQYFPRAEYRRQTIHLCTESCLGAFQSDPKRFYAAHRKSAHKTAIAPKKKGNYE
jgi:YHS domain-containing protein